MGTNSNGPNYTLTDLVYWFGFMASAIVGFLGATYFFPEWMANNIVRIVVPIVCGVGGGFTCEQLYRWYRSRPPQ
jgi:hypothetical protein